MDGLTEATVRPGNNPLADAYLRAAAKEIEQTSVAVSVVGTRKWKLKQMAALVEPIAEALVGERPEVSKARGRLKRLVHNARVSVTDARQASAALENLARGVRDVRQMVSKGIGNAEQWFKVSGFDVANTWGYSDLEIREAKRALERAAKALQEVGLVTVSGGLVELNPAAVKGSAFVMYDPDSDALVFDLKKPGSVTENAEKVLQALAERLWKQEFRSRDMEPWGSGRKGLESFSGAFAEALSGKRMSQDESARLRETVGKIAGRWPGTDAVLASLDSSWMDDLLMELVHPLGHVSIRQDGPWRKTGDKPPLWKKMKGSAAAMFVKEPLDVRRSRKKSGMQVAVSRIEDFVRKGLLDPKMSVQDHIAESAKTRKAHADRYEGFVKDLTKMTGKEVRGRVKDHASLLGKVTRTDDAGKPKYKSVKDLGDVTGARIVVDSIDEVYEVYKKLQKGAAKAGMQIENPDDKIAKPQGKLKYRSFHLDIVDKDGRRKELQIRTKRQDIVSDWGHDPYKPVSEEQRRMLDKHADEIIEYGAKVSDHFNRLDQGKRSIAPPCPKVAVRHFGCLT